MHVDTFSASHTWPPTSPCLIRHSLTRSPSLLDFWFVLSLQDASIRISQLASAVTESRRAHATALHIYRVSLKDMLAREQALKTVVRDREILVGKLLKLGNKKPNDSALHSHQAKLDDAQRELTACETYLQDEEIALSHAKRRTFRIALAERMVSLGELGRVMDESAHESHGLLVALGQDGEGDAPRELWSMMAIRAATRELIPASFQCRLTDFDRVEHRDDESIASDSITPSHSASQAMSRSSSSSSLEDQIVEQSMLRPSSRAQANGSTAVERAASPYRAKSPTFALGPIASGAPPDRLVSRQPPVRAAPPPAPRPILGPVPTAPRPVSAYLAQEAAAASALPSFEVPKAPTNVATRRPTDDSSDEETRGFVAHQNGLARTERSAHYPNDMPTSTSYVASRLQRHAPPSDTSSLAGGSKVSKRRGSIFGGLAALFKKKERRGDDSAARSAVMGGNSWDTRIDRNIFVAQMGANGGRAASVAPSRLRPGNDSSDDEPTQRNLVRVVNDPKMRAKAMSDLGRSRAASLHTVTTETVRKKKTTKRAGKAASDFGTVSPSTMPINYPSPTFLARPVSTVTAPAAEETLSVKKKKKKVPSGEGAATIVLSAEKLGIPTNAGASTATRPSKLSRSNTVTSNATIATATTGTVKKKKKKVVDDGAPAVPATPSVAKSQPVPTSIDLAASLPSARGTVYDTLTSPLPLPNGTPASRPSSPAPVDASPKANKVPKALAETGKRAKKESALHGNVTWVSHPSAATALPKKAGHAGEGQESMMSVVDRAEAEAIAEPSRKYGSSSVTTITMQRDVSSAGTPGTLAKRKSVRLTEDQPAASSASSIRSGQGAAPRHGILLNSNPPNGHAQGGSDLGASSTWSTRVPPSRTVDDSSDEDEDSVAYKKARKAFSKALNDKGKGKAVEQ